jgi:hypothetical protein
MMKFTRISTLAALLSLGMVAAGFAETAPWEQYKGLVENNIFSKARGAPQARARSSEPTAPPNPERFMLLRGVVRRGDEYVAMIEDMRNGEVLNLTSGDAVLDGRLETVTLDGVVYVRDDTKLELAIGDNFEKSGSDGTAPPGSAAGVSSSPASGTNAGGTQADMLERLRQRRLKETGK